MPLAFLDTSALVKRYRTFEKGSENVESITDERIFNSEKVIEKIHSLTAIKKRAGPFDAILIATCFDFDPETLLIVSSDVDLNLLAREFGFNVLDPENPLGEK